MSLKTFRRKIKSKLKSILLRDNSNQDLGYNIINSNFSVMTNYSRKKITKKAGLDDIDSGYKYKSIKINYNISWKRFVQLNAITIPNNKFFSKNSKIMTIGSCFADELRERFAKYNFDLYPKMNPQIHDLFCNFFKSPLPRWGVYDERVHYTSYNTFSILQEFEKAFGIWQQDEDDYLIVGGYGNSKTNVLRDPYRRYIESRSKKDLLAIRNSMDKKFKDGIKKSDLIVITLGMTEIFKLKKNDMAICQYEGKLDDYIYFQCSDFTQNYNNLDKICQMVFSNFPDKKIVMTVSPVPLNQTFQEKDIIVANTQSKNTLRTVVGELEKKWDNLYYYPSYEIALNYPAGFQQDKRHVKPELAEIIVSSFLKAHCE